MGRGPCALTSVIADPFLSTPLQFLKGVGPRKASDLKRAGRIEGEIATGDETTLHYAMDRAEDLMLIRAGSPIGALSMVLPGFSMEKRAGRSPTVLIDEP